VLPLIDNSNNPWWVRPGGESNNIYVFARIPFLEENPALVPPVLAIANTRPEQTEEDISLFSVTANIATESLQEIFLKHGLTTNILSTSGGNNFLLEVSRFIAVGDSIINYIKNALGEDSIVRLMGSYAVPVRL